MKKLVRNNTLWNIENEKAYFEGKNIKMISTNIKGI